MTLVELLDEFERSTLRLRVYAPEPPACIGTIGNGRSLDIEWKRLPADDRESFVSIHDDSGFVGSVGLKEFQSMLTEPTLETPDRESPPTRANFDVVLDTLTDRQISTLCRPELLATSHEFEERAYRIGRGTIRVGFQSLSVFRTQIDLYRRLATQTDLDVHIYGTGDWEPPEIPELTVHARNDDEVERVWFLAYDAAGDDCNKCALVAEETEPGEYRGFWTYDPEVVDEVMAAVERDYDRAP